MKKKFDAVVKTGTYQSNGETKNRYENVGLVMENDKGELMVLLKKTFNPAGVPTDAGRDNIIINLYPPKDKAVDNHTQAKQDGYQPPAPALDDEIPF